MNVRLDPEPRSPPQTAWHLCIQECAPALDFIEKWGFEFLFVLLMCPCFVLLQSSDCDRDHDRDQ